MRAGARGSQHPSAQFRDVAAAWTSGGKTADRYSSDRFATYGELDVVPSGRKGITLEQLHREGVMGILGWTRGSKRRLAFPAPFVLPTTEQK
jgi:hypothetical protein